MTDESRPDPENTGSGDETDQSVAPDRENLADLPDGCGCAEVWEYLSERRAEAE